MGRICRKRVKLGDAQECLNFFAMKRENEPSFFYKFEVDSKKYLEKIFWTESQARIDYDVFGDVIAFDTTYKKNSYDLPFFSLVGVNNHNQTIVFAFALFNNETIETYIWILETFLEAMSGKRPKSVCTDGCQSMRAAIRTVLPGVPHRLCAWHVARNANRRIHPWIIQKYLTRELWAQAYVTGNFFATVKSTLRCEGMHSYMKRNRRPVTRFSHLREFEEYVGYVYTERAFARFKRKVEREKGLSSRLVQSLNRVRTYSVMRYRRPDRVLRVEVHDDEGMIKCSCRKLETEGIPCRHTINIMKVEDMERIPDAMVLRRWRIECGKNNATVKPFLIDVEDTKIFRQASLRVLCNKICEGYK
ncbi:Zinc finger, PMZ-type [Corchorus olitorius]|uniref:Zinc finger, PMZ-type n=1 Tax=Corchorus olitorius TaxID=93759 RepID=A0A1R3KGN7_9ROSI|nr:Zinc finger, PMZ-type [Corchorus olitorius]